MDIFKWQKTLQEVEPSHFTASISLVVHMFQHGKSKNDEGTKLRWFTLSNGISAYVSYLQGLPKLYIKRDIETKSTMHIITFANRILRF